MENFDSVDSLLQFMNSVRDADLLRYPKPEVPPHLHEVAWQRFADMKFQQRLHTHYDRQLRRVAHLSDVVEAPPTKHSYCLDCFSMEFFLDLFPMAQELRAEWLELTEKPFKQCPGCGTITNYYYDF